MSKTLYRSKVFAKGTSGTGGGTDITVVANYSALPAASTVPNEFYWCSAAQGTSWLPGSLGGTYYSAGLYYSNGITWEYMDTPYQATQSEVDAGIVTNKFVTPATFENASKWSSKLNNSMSTNKLLGRYSASTGVIEEITIGSGLTLTGAGTLNNTATPTPLGYYGAWQDMVTQTAAVANTGYPLILRTVDLENQVRVVTNGTNLTRITFDNTGIYNLQFSIQVQNTGNSQHDVTVWLRKNGTDVTGSAGFISVPARKSAGAGNEGHGVYGWNYLLSIVAGEYYEFYWSTSNASEVSIQYYAAGSPPPSTASVIVTATQQSGIMAGTGVTAINSLTGAAQILSAGTTGSDFAISSSGTTHTFNLPTASATVRGALSSANWSTFNGKQDSLTSGTNIKTVNGTSLLGSGDLGIITGTYGGTGVNNGSKTITLGGNLTTTGAFNTTFSVPATATYTLPSATSTLLANNLGISGGTTIIGGTTATGSIIFQDTSNTTNSLNTNHFIWKMTTAAGALEESLRMGNGTGGEMNLYAMGNTTNPFIRTNFSQSYLNAATSCRLQVGTNDIITCSSTTATMVQGITITGGKDINFGTSSGTKIGAGANQLFAFWNKTPIQQPGVGIAGATRTGTGGTTITDTNTFGGYTVGQVVQALINVGLLA